MLSSGKALLGFLWSGVTAACAESGVVGAVTKASITSSLLWLPYSWVAFLALVLAPAELAPQSSYNAWLTAHLSDPNPVPDLTAYLAGVMLVAAVAVALVSLTQADAGNVLGRLLRAWLFLLALPGRLWAYTLGFLLALVLRHVVAATLAATVFAVFAMATDGLSDLDPLIVALVFIVILMMSGMVVGGTAWGNQWGSGTSGGMPLGCIIIPALLGAGLMVVLIVVVFVLAALSVPGFLYLVLASQVPAVDEFNAAHGWAGWVGYVGTGFLLLLPPAVRDLRGMP